MNNQPEYAKWADYLAGFTQRNRFRRARLECFNQRQVEEEAQEAHLERITLEMSGPGAPSVLLTRLDNSTTEPKTIVTTIPNVLRISAQFDTDDSEAGLEIEDKYHVLTIVRLESLVDGAS